MHRMQAIIQASWQSIWYYLLIPTHAHQCMRMAHTLNAFKCSNMDKDYFWYAAKTIIWVKIVFILKRINVIDVAL